MIILCILAIALVFSIFGCWLCLSNKIRMGQETYKNNFKNSEKINIYIDELSRLYTPHISKYIMNSSEKLVAVTNKNEADIYVYHINNNDYTKDKINIVISGEPDILQKQVDLYIGPVINQNAIHNIYYPQFYASLFEHRKSIDSSMYKSNKTKFCAFMYRAHHDHRVKYFNLLSKYKHVDALGESCKNTDSPTTRHINNETETYNDIAIDLYKNYKFVIAVENKDEYGYNTEKIINPLIANSIPIYWGNKKVFDYINKRRVIYIPDYSDDELITLVEKIDKDDNEYNRIMNLYM
jgi:hypothetical protein